MIRSYGFISILVMALAAHTGATGQEVAPSCPRLEVVGPAGRVVPGDVAVFTANAPDIQGLSYKWEVSHGVIESAIPMSIVVRTSEADDGEELRARVTVSGFPPGCPSTAEESVPVHREGPPPELDRYKQLSLSEEVARLDPIVRKLKEHDSERLLYFGLGKNPGETETQREKRMNTIRAHLVERGLSHSEVVFLDWRSVETTVWAVPIRQPRNEDAPSDPAARQIECPTITVTGPGGIVEPGGVAQFTAAIEGSVPKGIKLKWTVTDGTIIEEEDAYTLRVLAPRNVHRIDATLRVEGLDKRCRNTGTEIYEVIVEPQPILLEEFSATVSEIPRDALKRAVDQHRKNVASSLYIIEYFPLSVSQRAIEIKLWQTKAYMSSELGYGSAIIAAVKGDKPFTKIYLIPPGAEYPDY